MAGIDPDRVAGYLHRGQQAVTTTERGRALEDLICYVFETTPGISVTERNARNVFRTEEVDVAFWNDRHARGFRALPDVLLVECKNWRQPVGSQEIASFVRRLQNRALDLGFLIAANGVAGSPEALTDAHFEIAAALKDRVRLVVIDETELVALAHSDDLVRLVKRKLCMLAVRSTCF